MSNLSHLITRREAVYIQCGFACRRVRLCPERLMRERGDVPVSSLRFRCQRCGGKGRHIGSGRTGWPVVEVEILAEPPWELGLGR